jgi:4-hydroxy-tetrahydrodipicolinate reductase
VLAREGETGARPTAAIGVQALRGGDNPGEHSVLFLGRGERLELVHRATTRDHFARGALHAAAWLAGRPPGLYDMEQVLGLRA